MSRFSKIRGSTASRKGSFWRFTVGAAVVGIFSASLLEGDSERPNVAPRDFTPSAPVESELASSPKAMTDRAFWGAPPPMPHSFTKEWDAASCLQCHANENNIAKRQQAISPVPHAHLSQCQQCHVRQIESEDNLFALSEFIGTGFPGKGSRATPVSPPTIPHQTFMRENCHSCHGPAGEQRIATPHPYRSQCRQCHVSDIGREYSRSSLRP